MFKQLVLAIVFILSAFSLPAQAGQENTITMLVVPRDVIPIQVGQDISRRYPVLLVSYQLTRGSLKLHAWNGDDWVAVPVGDYTSGTFFANRPKHAVIVENERVRAPDVLIPNSTWCEGASRLTSTDPRVMLHLLGLHFDFSFSNWDQLAKRYGYSIEQINPTMKNVHWWNYRRNAQLEATAQREFSTDLNKWQDVRTLPPPPVTPAAEAEKLPVIKPAAPKPIESGTTVTPKAPAIVPAPVVEPAPKAPVKVVPAPVIEPAPKTPLPAPAPICEPTPAAPAVEAEKALAPVVSETATNTPVPAIEADPFATEEIPAAEIVVPQPLKKPWWKLF
ncbi:MAG: hypothetical protein HOO88_00235 [Kiritimatiellaceae bacterium]|nr:hypothetical protein [Kiritimatiellaceae bacterium]